MTIYLAADHRGFDLKTKIKKYFDQHNISYHDVGPIAKVKDDDYVDYAAIAAQTISRKGGQGIFICRSGVGVAIVANKILGVRAVLTDNPKIVKLSRQDDDTNVLCLSSEITSQALAQKLISLWLKTKFTGAARHRRRLEKIKRLETSR